MSRELSAFTERFLSTMWADHPTLATTMGVHDYDDRLGDLGADAWETRRRHLADLEREASALDAGALSPAGQVERELVLGHLRLTLQLYAERPPWELEPALYPNLAADSLFPLLVREFAPLPERARSMLGRLRQVPETLAQGRRTLTVPARVQTEIAVELTAGSVQFLETVIPQVAERAPEVGGELRKAAEAACGALRDFERFLQAELLPRSTGDFALGRPLFDRTLQLQHFLAYDADDLDGIGREAVAQTRAELEEVAAAIEPGTAWPELVKRARADHVATPAEVRPAYVEAMNRARRFVVDRELATIPAGESLEIIDTPVYLWPLLPYAAYMPPGPFEADPKGFFFVTPVDEAAPSGQQRAQLEGHNRHHMDVVALHEAYPGHHLQLVRSNAYPSRLRRFFANNVFCEGWALYCEQLMREMGFNEGPIGHLMQLRDQLWRACRIVVDVGLHTRGMSVEEGVRWLVEEACLEAPNARAEVKRYTMSPTQPMSYLIGKREIMNLRDAARARDGDRFTLRGFHDELLSHGTIPPALIRREMLGMKVARLHGVRDFLIETLPDPPPPGPGEALLRVTAVGICGSDLHYYREGGLGGADVVTPLIPGHEFAARVEAVGPGVELPVGTRVAVEPGRACGRCELCLQGHPNLCPQVQFCGAPPMDGALREYLVYPADLLFRLPDGLSDAEGAALEPLGIALHALSLAKLGPGETVAILGGGGIGLLLVQLCRVAGAGRIMVSEPVAHRRAAAGRFGATDLLDPQAVDVAAAVRDLTGGRGVDVVLEAAGAAETPAQAVAAVRPGGRIILVGIPTDDRLVLPHSGARRKGLTLKFARRMKHTYPRAISLAAGGAVDLHGYISHRFPLEAVAAAFQTADAYGDGALKVMIDATPWEA